MPAVEANDFKSESAEFMQESWLHPTGLDSNKRVLPSISADRRSNLFRRRWALPPQPSPHIVDDTNSHLTPKPTKWVMMVEAPMLRMTGRRRSDQGTAGESGAPRLPDIHTMTEGCKERRAFGRTVKKRTAHPQGPVGRYPPS